MDAPEFIVAALLFQPKGRFPSRTMLRASTDQPSAFVDVELHQTFVPHFQQEGLASLLIRNIGAFHNFIDLERLLAERVQDIFSIIQHD
jgi:hypothetical protein